MNLLKYLVNSAILFVVLLCSAFVVTMILRLQDAHSVGLVELTAFEQSSLELPELMAISASGSGETYILDCRADGSLATGLNTSAMSQPDWARFRCDVRLGDDRVVLAWFHFGERIPTDAPGCGETREYLFSSQVWPYRPVFSDAQLELPEFETTFGHLRDIRLTGSEMTPSKEILGSVRPWCFLGERAAQISFNLEAPSVEAIVAGRLKEAATLSDNDMSTDSARRIARELTSVLARNSGVFHVRQIAGDDAPPRNGLRLLLTGWFEYLILCFGTFAIAVSVIAMATFKRTKETARALGRLSVRITGMLTYLGLLGTLYGVFGAVNSLSSVDFLNEFRKVFDQTESFGSMSLAIGTSVVGLGAAVTVGLLQSLLSGGAKDDPFREG
ncbi:hypothetical protein [uncultured Tateyamaria sp.]|uniref:hypothetical protein n=1 Tax=uncultured Tateyamaria sp. TaxID=455651 RepID=UPI002604F9B0|nr:hypothetical protein [uncultured Tateyamaria sp.]